MENRLLARLFLLLAIGDLIGLLILLFLFLFFQNKTIHEVILISGSILLITGIIAFFASRSYIKRERNDR